MLVIQGEGRDKRPYAAASNVIAVLDRCRSRNLPPEIDDDFLRVAQIPDVVFGRVKQALKFLDLTDSQGRPTDKLRAMAGAPPDGYRELLGAALHEAYREDFQRVNPAEDSTAVMIAAFQPYEPRSQTKRMVMLFLGLCREAGLTLAEAPRERKMQGRVGSNSKSSTTGRQIRRTLSDSPPVTFSVGRSLNTSLLFGVTEKDIAALSDTEFTEVWAALGKVARARARSQEQPSQASQVSPEDMESA